MARILSSVIRMSGILGNITELCSMNMADENQRLESAAYKLLVAKNGQIINYSK